jgi:hypothetical protein
MSSTSVPAVPSLPLPASEFSQHYLNTLTNVLRLFFIPLTGAVQNNTNDISSITTLTWLNM